MFVQVKKSEGERVSSDALLVGFAVASSVFAAVLYVGVATVELWRHLSIAPAGHSQYWPVVLVFAETVAASLFFAGAVLLARRGSGRNLIGTGACLAFVVEFGRLLQKIALVSRVEFVAAEVYVVSALLVFPATLACALAYTPAVRRWHRASAKLEGE